MIARLTPDEKEVALAREHPRGTELRRLGPHRAALAGPAAYAALPQRQRDEIVRWAEVRRRIRVEDGIDANTANLVETLIPEARLRALVIEGEVAATGAAADVPRLVEETVRDGLPAVVAAIRDAGTTVCE